MKRFILCVALLLGLCVKSPAPTVNFASPPFSTDFIVNQPGNSIAIRFPGVTNVAYIPGTFGYISNQIVYLGTNNFSGGGGGGGGITTLVYTNGASIIVGSTLFTKTNYYASTSNGGGVTFVTSAGANGLNLAATVSATITGDVSASGSVTSLAATVTKINGQPLASLATGLLKNTTVTGVPVIAVVGVDYGTTTNVVYTNAGPDTLTIGPITYLNTNGFGGGGGGSGITQLTGDVVAGPGSGSQASTVKGLNGTILSGLQSGILFNTFGTGAPSTRNDWPSVASQLTLLIPQSALGTGSGGTGTKVLADDQTYKTFAASGGFSNQLQNVVQHLSFVQSTNINAGNGAGLSVGDMNGDGIPDIVVNATSATTVYTNAGNGLSFPRASTFAQTTSTGDLGLADVNADGKLDVIAGDRTGNYISVLTNAGNGTLAQLGSNYTTPTSPTIIKIYPGLIDGNGSTDFVAIYGNNPGQIWTNDGTGIFAASASLPTLFNGQVAMALADMRGTGTNDMVFIPTAAITAGAFGFIVYTNNGNGVMSPWVTNILNTTIGCGGVTVGDFNGDGKMDIAVSENPSAAAILVFTNNGTGFGLYSSNTFAFTSTAGALATADFNQDGKLDIIGTSVNAGNTVIYTNSGFGKGFSPAFTNAFAFLPTDATAGDFNGDGWPDFAIYQISSSQGVNVMLNTPNVVGNFIGNGAGITNGSITVTYQTTIPTPATAWTPGTPGLGTLALMTNWAGPFHETTSVATSGTVTTITGNQVETTYMSSSVGIATLTIALPSSSTTGGRFNYIHTKSAITNLTVTGGAFVDPAITTLTNGGTLIYEVIDTAGTYIRLSP